MLTIGPGREHFLITYTIRNFYFFGVTAAGARFGEDVVAQENCNQEQFIWENLLSDNSLPIL